MRLKVSHKDHGRVVIALANADRILVQVQIDESVLRYKGVHKSKASNNTKVVPKERPVKKKPAQSKKVQGSSVTKPVKTVSTKQPPKKATATTASGTKKDITVCNVPDDTDNDSTRSPKDLFKTAPWPAPPTASPTRQSTRQRTVNMGSSVSDMASLDMDDLCSPHWEQRRQKLLDVRTETKQEIGADDHDDHNDDAASVLSKQRRLQHRQRRLDRQRSEYDESFRSTRSIRSSNDGSSHHNTHTNIEDGTTTTVDPRSDQAMAGSGGTSTRNPRTMMRNTFSMKVQEPLVVELLQPRSPLRTNQQPPPQDKKITRESSRSRSRSHSRSLSPTRRKGGKSHSRSSTERTTRGRRHHHPAPHDDDDDDSTTMASSRRIRATLDEVRQMDFTNKMDLPVSTRRHHRKKPAGNTELDDEDMTLSIVSHHHHPNNWMSKLCSKVLKRHKNKRTSGGGHRHMMVGKHV